MALKVRGRIFHKKFRLKDGSVAEQRTWTVRFQGRDYNTGTEEYEKAEKKLLELAARRSDRKSGKDEVKLAALFGMVIDDYKDKADLRTVKQIIRDHLDPFFGHIRSGELEVKRIKAYTAMRLKVGAANATINRELARLSRAYTIGRENDLVTIVPLIKRLREDNVRQGFLSHIKYVELRDVLPDYLRCIFAMGYHVGCRVGELTSIRLDQVELPHREIYLWRGTTKNDQGRTLPIYGDMAAEIEKQIEFANQWDTDWLFSYLGERLQSFPKAWKTATKAVGLEGLLFHDLRRTAIRNMTRAGIPRAVARRISGHKTNSCYERYDIVDSLDLKDAGSKMETFFNAAKL